MATSSNTRVNFRSPVEIGSEKDTAMRSRMAAAGWATLTTIRSGIVPPSAKAPTSLRWIPRRQNKQALREFVGIGPLVSVG